MVKKWEDIEIKTGAEESVKATAPVIISASRATDIPAFYSQWLINRINAGYSVWNNPFNGRKHYISLQKARLFVFWSKNPQPMFQFLDVLDKKGIAYYFQFTLNDYEQEGFEPFLPPLEKRIECFVELSRRVGKEKVIWRFDPLVISPTSGIDELVERIGHIGSILVSFTDKLVVSFVDVLKYPRVRNNLIGRIPYYNIENIKRAEFTDEIKISFARKVQPILAKFRAINPVFETSTCAEEIDLSEFNITHNKCIDDKLIVRQFGTDRLLMDYLGCYASKEELLLTGKEKAPSRLKDYGQRKHCGCIASKDIGAYGSCPHHCTYCYANRSQRVAEANYKNHDCNSESI